MKPIHTSWKPPCPAPLLPLHVISFSSFILINQHILPQLYTFCAAEHSLSFYRKHSEKSKRRLGLSTEVRSNVTPGGHQWFLQLMHPQLVLELQEKHLLCYWSEGSCNLRASCHKKLASLPLPSWSEMTLVSANANGLKCLFTQKGDFYQLCVWSGYCNRVQWASLTCHTVSTGKYHTILL